MVIEYLIQDGELNETIAADLNEDGVVNISDIIALVNNIMET